MNAEPGSAEPGVKNCPVDNPATVRGFGPTRHWSAGLLLGFSRKAGKTVLSQMEFKGPLRVQRAFYPEGSVCHLYLLHPPGGLVSGDEVRIRMNAKKDSAALVTTPSAGKIYHSDSYDVRQIQSTNINVQEADFEWLPQETIVFDGANGVIDTRVDVQGASRFIGWDIFCLGRSAGNLPFTQGRLTQKLALYRDGKPVLLERQHIELLPPSATGSPGTAEPSKTAPQNCLSAAWGFGGMTVSGTLMATGFTEPLDTLVDELRASLNAGLKASGAEAVAHPYSVTSKLGVLLVRYLGHDSEEAKQVFVQAWQIIRPVLLGRTAATPRIWLT